jgi:hypothetical protein
MVWLSFFKAFLREDSLVINISFSDVDICVLII